MLEKLHVKGYALIDDVEISLSKGLNVLSGETGAGKSLLVDALGILLGEKGDTGAVRAGDEEADVTGVFRVDGCDKALAWLSEHGIEPEDGEVILRRTLRNNGKSRIFIQSVPSTKADLAEFTGFLIDMHGQHEHQSLLQVDSHRELIDLYGGHVELANGFHEVFLELARKKKQLEDLEKDERDRLREQDMLTFALNEIKAARLQEGEEEELKRESSLLAQSEKLFNLLEHFHELVAESGNGTLASLRSAAHDLSALSGIDISLAPYIERFNNAYYEIEDISESIRRYRDGIDFSPRRLEECEERLSALRRLEKKYGPTIKDVIDYAADCETKLTRLTNWEDEKKSLTSEIAALEKDVVARARDISDKRKSTAEKLSIEIQRNLVNLGMPKAEFRIEIGKKLSDSGKPVCGPWGMDSPEFLISANPGEVPKPLRKIASGGEMSRIMLAIKTVLAEADTIQGLVFDEIDAGIGGEVAVAVGRYLKTLSVGKQVLCVTHLATIAVHADNHIRVVKEASGSRTVTDVRQIEGEAKVVEIARMLAGDSKGVRSLAHAEEMLKAAGKL
ncbi:MAG: DNA repair protein RecN [Spirochaetales bacterium]|nr:DNA repair protein RecN [Spirochaetales bacterium]